MKSPSAAKTATRMAIPNTPPSFRASCCSSRPPASASSATSPPRSLGADHIADIEHPTPAEARSRPINAGKRPCSGSASDAEPHARRPWPGASSPPTMNNALAEPRGTRAPASCATITTAAGLVEQPQGPPSRVGESRARSGRHLRNQEDGAEQRRRGKKKIAASPLQEKARRAARGHREHRLAARSPPAPATKVAARLRRRRRASSTTSRLPRSGARPHRDTRPWRSMSPNAHPASPAPRPGRSKTAVAVRSPRAPRGRDRRYHHEADGARRARRSTPRSMPSTTAPPTIGLLATASPATPPYTTDRGTGALSGRVRWRPARRGRAAATSAAPTPCTACARRPASRQLGERACGGGRRRRARGLATKSRRRPEAVADHRRRHQQHREAQASGASDGPLELPSIVAPRLRGSC